MKNYEEKIKKLLALAESDNEHEAKAALLKAKELMAIYKIESFDLNGNEKKSVKRIETEFQYTKRGEWWMGSLADIIAENYCCRSAASCFKGQQKRTVIFVGLDGDVDICERIFRYAVDTARNCGLSYVSNKYRGYKLSFAEKNKLKNSYAVGFTFGVQEAFNKQKQENEAGWGLIMVVPKEVNDACQHFSEDKYKSKHSVYCGAESAGREEGRRFSPNSRIGNSKIGCRK